VRDPVETLAGRSRYFSRVDPEFLHARDQGRAFDIHSCRGPAGACYSPICDFQYADDLIAFIRFARPHHGNVPAVVAQFPDWSLQRRAVVRITERSMKFSSSRIFPGQCQLETFLMAAAGIDSISLFIRRPCFWMK